MERERRGERGKLLQEKVVRPRSFGKGIKERNTFLAPGA